MDFRLKVFQTVARNGSYTRAAKELKISQPAITKHIQELEHQFEVKLFERIGTSIRITPAGERFLSHCDRILDAFHWLDYDMHRINLRISGELRIGAGSTIAQYILPAILAKFIKKHPGIKFKITDGYSCEIEQALLKNQIDIGITDHFNDTGDIIATPFFKDQVVAICNTRGAIATHSSLTLKELKNIPLVMREPGCGSIRLLESAIQKFKLKLSDFNVMVNMDNAGSIKRFVEHCDCIGFVSENSVVEELAGTKLKTVAIEDIDLTRTFQFIRRSDEKNELCNEFIRFARKLQR